MLSLLIKRAPRFPAALRKGREPTSPVGETPAREGSEIHAAPGGKSRSALLLGLLGDHRAGGNEEAGD